MTTSRVLELQTIITVGNYEYRSASHFAQDASVNYEGHGPVPSALFSLRIDTAIDGPQNSLMVEESHAMPFNEPGVHNPFGVGYTTVNHIVESETPLDLDVARRRVFKIISENVKNPMSGGPVGYRLVPHYSQMVLAHPSSYHSKRTEFAEHAVWVTRYSDEERDSAGEHTMQSLGGEGIASWIRSRLAPVSVRNEDIVIWHAFRTTHNPRVEDWPVMPAEKIRSR
ncbi:hypothetical protein CNMCM5623_007385 [Aspergillus felis]|uniref:Amine oxidase n=1 Tax=Aspergillus felis TaxID=1287682 RepID=A0A8H6US00_9EURO|nr:hypothetical protein CNMCM5623_007385 [Aspergillus felis]KAF7178882.1 hypothetical protein CNMCM7691_007704 [Aspergillus felis]